MDPTLDPDRAPEPVTGLPHDPDAVTPELRRRLIEQWRPILAAFPHAPVDGAFTISNGEDDGTAGVPILAIDFEDFPQGQWADVDRQMAEAVHKVGWGQAGVSHGLNVRKGPYFFGGACGSTGCSWTMETTPIPGAVLDTDPRFKPVPELVPHPRPATSTP